MIAGTADLRDGCVGGEPVMVGSEFGVDAACFRLGEFDWAEEEALSGKHTVESRRHVDSAAIERTYTQTAGLSRLANAAGEEVGFKRAPGRDRSHAIAEDEICTAGAVLVAGRVTRPDQFADELREERAWTTEEDGTVKPRQAVWRRFCNGSDVTAAAAV